MAKTEIICAGFGGQGVLVTGLIIAHAAMNNDQNILWYPSYGVEMRGGTANCNVKISDEEVDFLWGLSPEEGAQRLLKEYGVKLVYVTLGPKGCHFANRNGCGEVASPAGIQVVDTTGAGDIFGGSAMSRFLKLNKAPDSLTVDEMEAVTRFACCAASLSTQTHGGIFSVVPEERVLSIL